MLNKVLENPPNMDMKMRTISCIHFSMQNVIIKLRRALKQERSKDDSLVMLSCITGTTPFPRARFFATQREDRLREGKELANEPLLAEAGIKPSQRQQNVWPSSHTPVRYRDGEISQGEYNCNIIRLMNWSPRYRPANQNKWQDYRMRSYTSKNINRE